ncbi:hypothetical protein [Nonomuraea sp. NPDC003804]|uniref:hypothetical protein n=1 Tax=Nonomuraea sp. NPDC003804 TaxID=3154547 RepID=UPI0033A076EC
MKNVSLAHVRGARSRAEVAALSTPRAAFPAARATPRDGAHLPRAAVPPPTRIRARGAAPVTEEAMSPQEQHDHGMRAIMGAFRSGTCPGRTQAAKLTEGEA